MHSVKLLSDRQIELFKAILNYVHLGTTSKLEIGDTVYFNEIIDVDEISQLLNGSNEWCSIIGVKHTTSSMKTRVSCMTCKSAQLLETTETLKETDRLVNNTIVVWSPTPVYQAYRYVTIQSLMNVTTRIEERNAMITMLTTLYGIGIIPEDKNIRQRWQSMAYSNQRGHSTQTDSMDIRPPNTSKTIPTIYNNPRFHYAPVKPIENNRFETESNDINEMIKTAGSFFTPCENMK